MTSLSALFGISPCIPGKLILGMRRSIEEISPGLTSPSEAISKVSLSSKGRMLPTLRRFGRVGSISASPAMRVRSSGRCCKNSTRIFPPMEKPSRPILVLAGMSAMTRSS